MFELPQEKKVQFDCDDSIANDGDACDTANEQACTADKKSMLVCKGNKFGSPTPCPGPAGCTHDEKADTYACDTGLGGAAPNGTAPATTGKGLPGKPPAKPPAKKK